MHVAALALLLSGSISAQPTDNLNFGLGTLDGWVAEEGKDVFYPTAASKDGPSLKFGVCSSDRGKAGRTGMIYRFIEVPRGAGVLSFTAYACYAKDCPPNNDMDVLLYAPGKKLIPKQVRTATGWKPVSAVLQRQQGRAREYIFPVANYIGQKLTLVINDEDKRPGCHIVCSGFRLIPYDQFEGREFSQFMNKLTTEHKLSPASRYASEHFVAVSNADEQFTELRLNNCELIYDVFFDHFHKKGFRVREPGVKLMVAVFDSQAGFKAYLGENLPSGITGVYHPASNRLLVYDYGTNEMFQAIKRQVAAEGRRIGSDIDRQRFIATLNRRAKEFRTETNIGTVMHEVAHQLSFNCGLLNREGDVPAWLAEGLACYCESTDNGSWQGIGEPNPERLLGLMGPPGSTLIPLRDMVASDNWLRGPDAARTILLGYAQSWALFRMLMEERPQALRNYLALIYSRRTGDHRNTDFLQVFGGDLPRMELRFGEYVKEIVSNYRQTRR